MIEQLMEAVMEATNAKVMETSLWKIWKHNGNNDENNCVKVVVEVMVETEKSDGEPTTKHHDRNDGESDDSEK